MTLKRHFDADGADIPERVLKLAKFDSDTFQKALCDSLSGQPTVSEQLKSAGLHVLRELCDDFGLLKTPQNSYTKSDYVSMITQCMNQHNFSFGSCKTRTTTKSFLNIRLFKKARDYPTTFLAEIHAPRSSCGDLNLNDLSFLFNLEGHFEVIDSKTYKPILIQGCVVPQGVIDLLLQTCSYIRVVCKT